MVRAESPTKTNLLVCTSLGETLLVVSSGFAILGVVSIHLYTLTGSITSPDSGKTTLIPTAQSCDNFFGEQSAKEYFIYLVYGKGVV